MAGYRDELDAARHRVTTLEAQLAERDASLRAREAELAERSAEVERLKPGASPGAQPRGRGTVAVLLAIIGVLLIALGASYLGASADGARARAETARARLEAERARAEAERARAEAGRAQAEAERAQAEVERMRKDALSFTREDRTPAPSSGSAEDEASGTLNINSIPPSKVVLDGKAVGSTPMVGLSVAPGEHTVTFIHPELGKKSVIVHVKGNETRTAAVKFR